MQIANFERRVFSYLFDLALVTFTSVIIFFFLIRPYININWAYLIIPTTTSLLFILFNGTINYLTNGYTLGDLIFGIRMVSIKYQRLTFKQNIIKYLSLSLFPCVIINAIYMLCKHTEKTIFDELSHTISISMRG